MSRSPNARRLVPCMPPLLDEETIRLTQKTSYSGASCENVVKSYFLSKNINVADPHVDDGADLLIEKPEGWVRGQVKKVVYQNKLDHRHKKNFNGEIYRSRFEFLFQNGSASKINRVQRGPESTDYFYHVLLTPYRQLIWETPVSLITLRENGSFIQNKSVVLDRDNWVRMVPEINFNELLLSSQYNPIIFKRYPEFFLKEDKVTVDEFFV